MPEASRILDPFIRRLANSRATAVVDGHCVSFGSVAGREVLSLARAQAVLDYLVRHGVEDPTVKIARDRNATDDMWRGLPGTGAESVL
jgi:outer membrane protein OmpA-like peptidoglycan-associated protein